MKRVKRIKSIGLDNVYRYVCDFDRDRSNPERVHRSVNNGATISGYYDATANEGYCEVLSSLEKRGSLKLF